MKQLVSICVLAIILLFSSCKQNESNIDFESENINVLNSSLKRVEPPNWWIGFKNEELQLLINHPNIANATPELNYIGVSIKKIHKADSPNYLFIDLNIADNTKAGKFNITFNFKNSDDLIHTYELKKRENVSNDFQGFDSRDAIYLITPDRFSNANTKNDSVEGLLEQEVNRNDNYERHGGDIQGITSKLDYISDLGFTAIWSSPLLINDMQDGSYHGYAITDYYKVDPRFGTMGEYIGLANKAKEKGIKLIMDQIANHCGLEHWWMKDLPFNDWVNYQKEFENKEKTNYSNHRRTSNQDLYASNNDKQGMSDGWFVSSMPDLNQRNPFMAAYIIQNSIWWIETLKLNGIRQDTYPYPDKNFMSDWAGAIMNEYPDFNIVGEEWSYNPLLISYWQDGSNNVDGYKSNLKSTMDFAMQSNIVKALNEEESWDKGLVKIYEGLANDFAYASPKDIMIFPDNHDMSRIFTQMKGDIANTKMALSYILSLPRIPQIYYGTEILMDDFKNPGDHGLIRTDFPGGWEGDTVNAFTGEGLSSDQKDMQQFIKKILNYRKTSKAIHEGKTVHFAPFMGTYFLFRILGDEVVVHIINKNDKPITIDLKRFAEIGLEGKTLKNVITDEEFLWQDNIVLNERGSILFTTKK